MKNEIQLKDIATHSKGKQINGNELIEDGNYNYLNGGINPSGKWNDYNVKGNTITISEGGNSCGYVNFMNNPFWCGAHCYYLSDVSGNVKYLYYALKSQQERIMKLRSGACMPNIKKGDLGEFKFVYNNDITEQIKAVECLEKVEAIIEYRKQQLIGFDDLIKSRFVEMFGDPTTNPKGWIKKKLSDECDIVTGNTPSRQVSEYYGDYIEWIKSDNINTPSATITKATEYLSEAGLSVARSVEAGSILMTCIAGSIKCIGNVAITDRKVSFNQQINGIVPRKNNTWFIYEQFELSKPYIQSTINMSLKGILSKGQLSEIEFIFPPTDYQNEFGKFILQVDKLKVEVEKSLNEAQMLFNSLMQKYFE